MATGGEVTYIINSDDKDFTRAIDSADSKMGAFDKKSRNVGGFVKGLFTYDMIKGAVTGMADLVSNTISYTGGSSSRKSRGTRYSDRKKPRIKCRKTCRI